MPTRALPGRLPGGQIRKGRKEEDRREAREAAFRPEMREEKAG